MADGRHIEKIENRHISAVVRAISTKFITMMQFIIITVPTVKNLKFRKSKMAAAAILKSIKIDNIYATVRVILTKFSTMTQYKPYDRCDR